MLPLRKVLPLLLLGTAAISFPQDKKLAKIENRVIDSITGEPVRKAKLMLGQYTAETDARGRFLLDNLEPGTYRLVANKPGYLGQPYGARSPRAAGVPLTLEPGQHLEALELKMIPQGIISGRVLDEDGEPVGENVFVDIRPGAPGRRPPLDAGQMANNVGEFRIPNLEPGPYLVIANPLERSNLPAGSAAKTDDPVDTPVPTYYPGVTDAASASVVDVQAGRETSGLEIVLRKAKAYRVEGALAGLTAAYSPRRLQLVLFPRDVKDRFIGAMGHGRVNPDGTFVVENVVPGSYILSVLASGDRQPYPVGRLPVDVVSSPVRGLVVHLTGPLTVTGTVAVEGGKAVPLDTLRIGLRPLDAVPSNPRPVSVKPDGSFKLENVSPDRYSVYLYGPDDSIYLKSARWGSQDVLDPGLDLSEAQGTAALQLVLGTNPGSVEGVVRLEGKSQPGVNLTLAPERPRTSQAQFTRFTTADQNGRYTIKGAAPGKYKLYALPDFTELDLFFGLDALKPFEGQAVAVEVQEGRTTRANLTPINPAEAPARTPSPAP